MLADWPEKPAGGTRYAVFERATSRSRAKLFAILLDKVAAHAYAAKMMADRGWFEAPVRAYARDVEIPETLS